MNMPNAPFVKPPLARGLAAALIASSGIVAGARAGQYSIDWYKVAGGGGTSSGGAYAVSGTIGQPDTALMTGGNFTLQGGFWSVVAAVQTPGAPTLIVTRQGDSTLKVAWPKPADGWILESSPALSGPARNWTQIASPYADDGKSLYFVIGSPTGTQFYRLHKP